MTSTPEVNVENPISNDAVIQKIKEGIKGAVVRGEFEVPSLPNVTAEVMKLLSNPNVGLNQLELVIKQDPSIAGRVVKMANSPLFRGAMEIISLQAAMSRIGLKNVKDIVVTIGIQSKAFNVANFELILAEIWKNSLSSAVIAQRVAKSQLGDKESAFLAGLMSNIGKPVLVQICSKVETKARDEEKVLATKAKRPFDPKTWRLAGLREEILPKLSSELHTMIGASVAARWGLPEPITQSIKFLNDPTKCPEKFQKLAWTLKLTHRICEHFGFGLTGKSVDFTLEASMAALSIEMPELEEMLEEIPELVNTQLSSLST